MKTTRLIMAFAVSAGLEGGPAKWSSSIEPNEGTDRRCEEGTDYTIELTRSNLGFL